MLRTKRTLTLIEVTIAVCIFAIISIVLYSLLRTAVTVRKKTDTEGETHYWYHLNLDLIAKELRNVITFKDDTASFKGFEKGFQYYTVIYDYAKDAPAVRLVSYEVLDRTLVRKLFHPLSNQELKSYDFFEDLKYFQCFYYDGEARVWKNEWDEDELIPAAVRMSVRYGDDEAKEFEIDKYVYIAR